MIAKKRPAWVEKRFDQHGTVDPERVYLVASLQRTGSTLLTKALTSSGRFGVPEEFFLLTAIDHLGRRLGVLPITLQGQLRRARRHLRGHAQEVPTDDLSRAVLVEYVRGLQRIRTTPNGVFGVKLQYQHFDAMRGAVGVDLLELVQPRRVVLLTRRDHVRQAVSFYRALHDGQWRVDETSDRASPPSFDRSAIEALVQRIEVDEAGWREALATYPGSVHEMTYEDLDADFDGEIRRCFSFLGEPDAPLPDRADDRLADATTEEWVARLTRDRGPEEDQ
jgi:LPS sulfotransferase NodH